MHARDTAELGHQSFYIKRELGRGTYGVVYLVEDTETKQILAMKVQKPIGSLAHEFLILNTLKTRLGKAFADQYLSIPTSLGIFSDGGCKLMAIEGNDEDKFIGMNLVDIVNVFQKAGEPIPEVRARERAKRSERQRVRCCCYRGVLE
jgi:serine/threonine protein kinase